MDGAGANKKPSPGRGRYMPEKTSTPRWREFEKAELDDQAFGRGT